LFFLLVVSRRRLAELHKSIFFFVDDCKLIREERDRKREREREKERKNRNMS
jgi:hypothetical protein